MDTPRREWRKSFVKALKAGDRFTKITRSSSDWGERRQRNANMPNIRKREEFPVKSRIIVTPEVNPPGSKAYRVDIPATITGQKREQRQFPTKEEARRSATKRQKEITKFGHSAFALTSEQRTDATRAIAVLDPYGLTACAQIERI